MKRRLGWIAIAWLLAVTAVALIFYGAGSPRLTLAERAHAVETTLRCPNCPGESVAESSSDIAKAMRGDITRRLAEGQTPAQIRSFYASRYGQFVLLSPPASGIGSIAWVAPPLLTLGGFGLLVTLVLEWRRREDTPVPRGREEYLARVRAELAEARRE